jgi:hypothetical protein
MASPEAGWVLSSAPYSKLAPETKYTVSIIVDFGSACPATVLPEGSFTTQ